MQTEKQPNCVLEEDTKCEEVACTTLRHDILQRMAESNGIGIMESRENTLASGEIS